MKINAAADKAHAAAIAQASGRVASDTKDATPVARVDATAASASATVTLSNVASTLMGEADPTFDADKVAAMKDAIDKGTYQVNPEAIADKLLANAREVLGGGSGNSAR